LEFGGFWAREGAVVPVRKDVVTVAETRRSKCVLHVNVPVGDEGVVVGAEREELQGPRRVGDSPVTISAL
jgi:hypothetical protein